MKKTLILMCCALTLFGLTACGTNKAVSASESTNSNESVVSVSPSAPSVTGKLEIDETKAEKVVTALFGGGWLGSSYDESNFENESHKNDLAFTTFYCMMNPGCAYPDTIADSTYEPFIQGYFDVSTDFLRGLDDYDAQKNAYEISGDISVDMLNAQVRDYFKIDSVEEENGQIKVAYRILFGKMAGNGDGSDLVFEGYALLKENGDYYHVNSITVTEDNSKKYDI